MPEHVRVSIDEKVPVIVRAQMICLLGYVNILVFVQFPTLESLTVAINRALVAALLVNGACSLSFIEVEIGIVFLGIMVDRIQTVVDAMASDVLFQVRKDEKVLETFQNGHELGGDFRVGLSSAGLDNNEDLRCIRKGIAGRVVRSYCMKDAVVGLASIGRVGVSGAVRTADGRDCKQGAAEGPFTKALRG